MHNSIYLAQLLGPVYAIVGLALALRARNFGQVARAFLSNPAFVYLAGIMGLVIGVALVLAHNVWVADWPVLITAIAWITLLRALATLFLPGRVVALSERVVWRPAIFRWFGALNALLGLALCYFGYR